MSLRLGCALILFFTLFTLYYSITRELRQLEVFSDHNVMFHADPMWRLRSFGGGYGWGDRDFVHPNLGNYFSYPIRIIAKAAVVVGLSPDHETSLRNSLALLVSPAFGAATGVVVFFLAGTLGLAGGVPLLMGLIAGLSFSSLIFASIPDHFSIGGFCVGFASLLAADLIKKEGKIRRKAWLALGVFTLGITSTNILWVGILFCTALWVSRKDWRFTLRTAAIWGLSALALTLLIADLGARIYGVEDKFWSLEKTTRFVDSHLTEDGSSRLTRSPSAISNTFSPSDIGRTTNRLADKYDEGRKYRFTLLQSTSLIPTLIVLPLLMAGLAGWIKVGGALSYLAYANLAILNLNLVMHSLFGDEYFVYSQHWLVPALILLMGIFAEGRRVPLKAAGVAVIALFMVINNGIHLANMTQILSEETSTSQIDAH